jgi:hypothetical protein
MYHVGFPPLPDWKQKQMVKFGIQRRGGGLNSAFITFCDKGAHVLLMAKDACKRDRQQKQSKRKNRDRNDLNGQTAKQWSSGTLHSSVI